MRAARWVPVAVVAAAAGVWAGQAASRPPRWQVQVTAVTAAATRLAPPPGWPAGPTVGREVVSFTVRNNGPAATPACTVTVVDGTRTDGPVTVTAAGPVRTGQVAHGDAPVGPADIPLPVSAATVTCRQAASSGSP